MNSNWTEPAVCLHYILIDPNNPIYADGCSCDELDNIYCAFAKDRMVRCPMYKPLEVK